MDLARHVFGSPFSGTEISQLTEVGLPNPAYYGLIDAIHQKDTPRVNSDDCCGRYSLSYSGSELSGYGSAARSPNRLFVGLLTVMP